MALSESAPSRPQTISHTAVMEMLGVSKERLALIIIKHPGVVYKLKEISDELPILEESETDAPPPAQRQTKRLSGNRRIINNMAEAIKTMKWDGVVEYLERNCYRMRFHTIVVETLRERKYLEETGGKFMYHEARNILGLSEEEMVQHAGDLGVSLPSFDINSMGESKILHGFFDYYSEEDLMTSSPDVFIQMQERTPNARGFPALLRANIKAMYFESDKVFALKKKLQGEPVPLGSKELPVKEEIPVTPSPTPQPEQQIRQRQGHCFRNIVIILTFLGALSVVIYTHQKEVRSWLESLGLDFPFEKREPK